jgi:hypothetical protein
MEYGDDSPIPYIDKDMTSYYALKNRFLQTEANVLEAISFDLTIEHPYKHLSDLVTVAKVESKRIIQNAWSIINDSFFTPLCLSYEPIVIASGALYLGMKMENTTLAEIEVMGEKKAWYDDVGVSVGVLTKISSIILELYARKEHSSRRESQLAPQQPVFSPSPSATMSSPSYNTPRAIDDTPRSDCLYSPSFREIALPSEHSSEPVTSMGRQPPLPSPFQFNAPSLIPSNDQAPFRIHPNPDPRYSWNREFVIGREMDSWVGIDRRRVDVDREREMERDRLRDFERMREFKAEKTSPR